MYTCISTQQNSINY